MKFKISLIVFLSIVSSVFAQKSNQKLIAYVDTKIGVIGTSASNCLLGPQLPFAQTLPVISEKFGQSRVYTKGDSLFVNTGEVERVWVWTGNGLVTRSIKNVLTGQKYSNSQKNVQSDWMLFDPQIEKDKMKGQSTLLECDWNLLKADAIPLQAKLESLTAKVNDDEGFTNKYIEVVSQIRYESLKLEVQHVIWVYPNSPGIRTQLRVKALAGFKPGNFSKNDTITKYYGGTLPIPGGRAEFLPLDFSVKNQRDYWGYYNDPGNRHDQSLDMLKEEVVQGYPLFQNESNNWASGIGIDYGEHGVCVIKESPKTVNQQGHNTGSFYSRSNGLWITGLGLLPAEVTADRFRECWANWMILYSGNNDNMQLAG